MTNFPYETTVFTCRDSLESMMTGIYEAYASRLGHGNIRLELEPVCQPQLFCRYISVETDEKKASAVIRSIKEKISAKAWETVFLTAMSWRSDRPDLIYRFLLLGFHHGPAVLNMMQYEAVFRIHEVSRSVYREAHLFREFIRFSCTSQNVLVSHIEPKSNILSLTAPHFCDRMPSENWIILDDNRQMAAVHPAGRDFYLTYVTRRELSLLKQTEKADACSALWMEFFHSVSIRQRYNPRCQRSLMPLWYRRHMTEFMGAGNQDT